MAVPQMEEIALRPMRPVCVRSPAARLPMFVLVGQAQLGSEKLMTFEPPV